MKASRVVLVAASIGLLSCSVYRAATFPFTHDESLSFSIFSGDPNRGLTANNHVLNTVLMQWCSRLLGNSELSLRLPNVLAHAAYLVFSLLLLRRVRSMVLGAAGFVLLNMNPFVLDYFTVARGYGLGLACLLASLYWLVRGLERKQASESGFGTSLYLAVTAASLASLANSGFVYFHLPMLFIAVWLLLSDASRRRFSRVHADGATTMLALSGIFLAFICFLVARMQFTGQLYFGGQIGFVSDTIGSLAKSSLYLMPDLASAAGVLTWFVVLSSAGLLLLSVQRAFARKEATPFSLSLAILASAAIVAIGLHRWFGALYPVERAALPYVPVYAVTLTFGLDAIVRQWPWLRGAVLPAGGMIAVAATAVFIGGFNLHTLATWPHDGHNREVIEVIERDHGSQSRPVMLGVSWEMQPSVGFYRVTRADAWLQISLPEPIDTGHDDYIYAFRWQTTALGSDRYSRILEFGDTATVLLRARR